MAITERGGYANSVVEAQGTRVLPDGLDEYGRRVFSLAVASTHNIITLPLDSISTSDSITSVSSYHQTKLDSIGLTDSITTGRVHKLSLLDSVTFSDSGVIASDSFSRQDNQNSLGTAETGQVWNALSGIAGGILSGKAYTTSTSDARFSIDTSVSDNYTLSVDATWTYYTGLLFRVKDVNNFMMLRVFSDGFTLYRVIGGTSTSLATYSFTPVNGQTYNIKVNVSGQTFTSYLDGVQRISYTDSDTTLTNSTGVGFRSYNFSGSNQFDNLVMTRTQFTAQVTRNTGIVTSGLVGYWNSKQGVSGTTWTNLAPSTQGSYNAIITGATVGTNGMTFSDASTYVQVPLPTEFQYGSTSSVSVELRFNSSNIANVPDILTTGSITSNGGSNSNYAFYSYTNAFAVDMVESNGNGDEVTFNYTPVNGVDYYVSYVFDQSTRTVTLYLNGQLLGSQSYVNNTSYSFAKTGNTHVWISDNKFPFNGVIDNIRFYNRALTSSEVFRNYNIGTSVGLSTIGVNSASLLDTVSMADTTKQKILYTKTESIIVADTTTKQKVIPKTDTILTNDTISSVSSYTAQLSDYITTNDVSTRPTPPALGVTEIGKWENGIFDERGIRVFKTDTTGQMIFANTKVIPQSYSRALGDPINVSDSSVVRPSHKASISDNINIVDSISKVIAHRYAKLLTDSISSIDNVTTNIHRVYTVMLSDIISTTTVTTVAGSHRMLVSDIISAIDTGSGTADNDTALTFVEGAGSVGTLGRTTTRSLSDIITSIDSQSGGRPVNLYDSITSSDSRSGKATINKSDSITGSDSRYKGYASNRSDSISSSDSRYKSYNISRSDSMASLDSQYKKYMVNKSDSILTSDVLMGRRIIRAIVDTIISGDTTSEGKAIPKLLSDTISLTEGLVKHLHLNEYDNIPTGDNPKHDTPVKIIDSINASDSLNKILSRIIRLSDTISSGDITNLSAGDRRLVGDIISISDTLVRQQISRFKTDSIISGDRLGTSNITRLLGDVMAPQDILISGRGTAAYLLDTIVITDTVSRAIRMLKADNINTTDTIGNNVKQNISIKIDIISDIAFTIGKHITLEDTINSITEPLHDDVNTSNMLNDYVAIMDILYKQLSTAYQDSIDAEDSLAQQFIESVSTFILTLDTMKPIISITVSDFVSTYIPFNVIVQANEQLVSDYTAVFVDSKGNNIPITLTPQGNLFTGSISLEGAATGTGVLFVTVKDMANNATLSRRAITVSNEVTDYIMNMNFTVDTVSMDMTVEKVII